MKKLLRIIAVSCVVFAVNSIDCAAQKEVAAAQAQQQKIHTFAALGQLCTKGLVKVKTPWGTDGVVFSHEAVEKFSQAVHLAEQTYLPQACCAENPMKYVVPLVEAGADVDWGRYGAPLECAAGNTDKDGAKVVKLLLFCGANKNTPSSSNWRTPLQNAQMSWQSNEQIAYNSSLLSAEVATFQTRLLTCEPQLRCLQLKI